jgi:hypothetical protein
VVIQGATRWIRGKASAVPTEACACMGVFR